MKPFHEWMSEKAGSIVDNSTIDNNSTSEVLCDEYNITDEPVNSIYDPDIVISRGCISPSVQDWLDAVNGNC